jgi:hypothetical protein
MSIHALTHPLLLTQGWQLKELAFMNYPTYQKAHKIHWAGFS